AAARNAASLGAAPHSQPRYMKVDRRHLPPETNHASMSPAAPMPATSSSAVRRAVTKSATAASTASRSEAAVGANDKAQISPTVTPSIICCDRRLEWLKLTFRPYVAW